MHHGNRHGRSEEARQAVLEAADDLLVEKGYAGLTMEGIARRAGVAKQTIYRWWSSKTEILIEAFVDDAAEYLTPADTGDLATDLRRHLAKLATFLTATDAGAVFRALAGEAQHDPALAERLRAEHLGAQRERGRQPLLRAISRGDLPAGTDVDFAVDQLVGPIYYRVLVTGEPVSRKYTDHLVTQYLKQI
ncbi:TetR/AcrR family transcriptional regulator [Kribbella endophytica]